LVALYSIVRARFQRHKRAGWGRRPGAPTAKNSR